MCGIVGAITSENANNIVLEGLKRLEYRGYDSCGITYKENDSLVVNKSVDRIADLMMQVKDDSSISFGHTRWATHGGVNIENAHPHLTLDNKMAIVHNGVIENYCELKKQYVNSEQLQSETDTEILLYTLYYFYEETKDMNLAIQKFMDVVEGSYALIVHLTDDADKLYVIKNKSPLLIGKGENLLTISSDPSAVIDKVSNFYQMEDKKYAILDASNYNIELFNQSGEKEELQLETIEMEYKNVELGSYSTYMEKEIEEQPNIIRRISKYYGEHGFDSKLKKTINGASKIYIVASGTSYNAGLICKPIIEEKLAISTEVVLGSEFGYSNNIIPKNSFFIFLSQSGETADSMLVLNQVKNDYHTLAITNVYGSQMDRAADFSLNILAGQEIAVASTKAYTAQIAVASALIYSIASDESIFKQLEAIADNQEQIIKDKSSIQCIANQIKSFKEIFYIGRLQDSSLANEASLKLKEITYINVSAFAAGELKHGTISLIDESKLTIGLISNPKVADNTRSNLQEVRARNGNVIVFATEETSKNGDDYIIKSTSDILLAPLTMVVVHQYLALFTATYLKLDVDKPRNLAKAVTVE